LQQLLPIFERYGVSVGAAMRVPYDEVSKYGVYAAQEVAPRTYRVGGIVEKPTPHDAPSNLAAVKGYILTPEIFELLAQTAPGRGGEVWLTDALNPLAQQGRLYAYAFEGQSYDAGDALGLLQAHIGFALQRSDVGPALKDYLRSVVGD
jgi:UTP--glucose-1-phosphate uridylyltransferase